MFAHVDLNTFTVSLNQNGRFRKQNKKDFINEAFVAFSSPQTNMTVIFISACVRGNILKPIKIVVVVRKTWKSRWETPNCVWSFGSSFEFINGIIVARQQMTATSPTAADCSTFNWVVEYRGLGNCRETRLGSVHRETHGSRSGATWTRCHALHLIDTAKSAENISHIAKFTKMTCCCVF